MSKRRNLKKSVSNMSLTIFEARKWASSFLKENNREARVAEILLRFLLNKSLNEWLIIQSDPLDEEIWNTYEAWIKEHALTGKPVEHFTNEAEFFGRIFYVDENVLIPRPETEELLLTIKDEIQDNDTIVDIGTGSGIIAITLKLEKPKTTVFATDLSNDALEVARKNAQNHHAEVKFLQGSFLNPIIRGKIEPTMIVSNPPYIPNEERVHLDETVLHDPELALFAENNGLAAYEQIIDQIFLLEKMPRLIAFEIGYDQGKTVPQLIYEKDANANVQVIQDINGKDRIVVWKNE